MPESNRQVKPHDDGSLLPNAPAYNVRQADEELYQALKQGQYCYVLGNQPAGRTSLAERTRLRLQDDGFACSFINLNEFIQKATLEQWYRSFIERLVNNFQLWSGFDLEAWWQENENVSLIWQLSEFFEQVILKKITQPLVIFLDNIDSVLKLGFCLDDFFVFIRYCYNYRAINREFQRLTFVLLGAVKPRNLMQHKINPPFNIKIEYIYL